TYERLAGYKSLQWPVAPDGTDQPLLYTERFPFPDGKAKLFPVEVRLPKDAVDVEYDLHLNNGRLLEHFHEGILTYRSKGLSELVPESFVETPPQLPREPRIKRGHLVKLISRHGELGVRPLVTGAGGGNEV